MVSSAPTGSRPLSTSERCSYEVGRRLFERGDLDLDALVHRQAHDS